MEEEVRGWRGTARAKKEGTKEDVDCAGVGDTEDVTVNRSLTI